MIATLLLLFATAEGPPPTRAETCNAHIMIMIEDAMAESGRVAGPSWFIRDWWQERMTDEEYAQPRQDEVRVSLRERAVADPEAFAAERQGCADEAIKAGAVPGWND